MMCCYLNVQFQGQRVIELKTAIPAYTRNISQADLQKVFENKTKRVQACIDARAHHFPTPFVSAQRLFERTVLCAWLLRDWHWKFRDNVIFSSTRVETSPYTEHSNPKSRARRLHCNDTSGSNHETTRLHNLQERTV